MARYCSHLIYVKQAKIVSGCSLTWRRMISVKGDVERHIGILLRNVRQGSRLLFNGWLESECSVSLCAEGVFGALARECIWHKVLPLSISLFMWKLLNHFLALDEERMKYGVSLASRCLCLAGTETYDHIFLHCVLAKVVWQEAKFCVRLVLPIGSIGSLREMLSLWWFAGDSGNRQSCILMACAAYWSLWKARCHFVYEAKVTSQSSILAQFCDYYTILMKAKGIRFNFGARSFVPRKIMVVKWGSDIGDIGVVLNIDGASKGNPGFAGIGGILRDNSGNFISDFSIFIGENRTRIEAELAALLHGLRMADRCGLSNFLVQSDSAVLVQAVTSSMISSWKLDGIFHQAISFLGNCRIVHVYREVNSFPDALANLAISTRLSASYSDYGILPTEILGLMALDKSITPYVRIR